MTRSAEKPRSDPLELVLLNFTICSAAQVSDDVARARGDKDPSSWSTSNMKLGVSGESVKSLGFISMGTTFYCADCRSACLPHLRPIGIRQGWRFCTWRIVPGERRAPTRSSARGPSQRPPTPVFVDGPDDSARTVGVQCPSAQPRKQRRPSDHLSTALMIPFVFTFARLLWRP